MASSSGDFEKGLMRRARARIRESPVLREDFDDECRARRLILSKIVLDILAVVTCVPLFLVCPLFVSLLAFVRLGPDRALVFHSLLSLITAYTLTVGIRSRLKRSQLLSVMSHLPVEDRAIASRVLWEWTLVSLVVIYVNLCFYGVIAWNLAPMGWIEVLLLAVGQWLVWLVTAIILAAWIHERLLKVSFVLLIVALVACCFLDPIHLQAAKPFLLQILPTGWLNELLRMGVMQGQQLAFWTLAPVVAWCLWGRWSKSVLEAAYRIHEFTIQTGSPAEATAPATSSLATNLAAESLSWPPRLAAQLAEDDESPRTAAELVKLVQSRQFLNKQDWSKLGWIERLVDRWLTPRERILIEFLTSQQIQWTSFWSAFLWQVPFYFLMGWALGDLRGMFGILILLGPVSVAIGPWPAFRSRSCGGVYLPQIAAFPCGFDEVRHVMLKLALVRCFALMAYQLIPCAVVTMGLPFWPLEGIIMALGCCALIMLACVWQVIGLFSLSIGFARMGWLNALCILIWAGLMFAVVIGLPVTYLFWIKLPQLPAMLWVVVIGAGILILCTSAGWFLLRILYRSGAVDLVRTWPSMYEPQLERTETTYLRSRRVAEIQKKHGWFWWLKRAQREAETG